MPNKTEIAVISAEINGGAFAPTGLRFELSVNNFPVVTASIADVDGDVVAKAPVSADVLATIAKLQSERLEGRSEPDFNVDAADGLGGSISYSGYISSPILENTRVSTVRKISSVGQDAMLDALDLSIYKASYELPREEAGSDMKPVEAAKDGNVTKTLAAVTSVLVGNYDLALDDEYRPVSKRLLELQHEINQGGPLETWETILSNSEVVYESWDEAFGLSDNIGRALAEHLKSALESPTPGFWNNVRSLMAGFQMFYVPSFSGPGKFVRADKKIEGEADATIQASVTGITVGDGSPRLLQPGGVVMVGSGAATARRETSADPSIARVVAFAPDPLKHGFIQRESVPFWLLREEGIPVLGSEVETAAAAEGEVNLSLTAREARRTGGLEFKEKVDLASEGIMTELCEVMFKEIQLAHSTVSLNLPLDFSMNDHIGQRVTVEVLNKDGATGGSFSAFVAGITHSVDLRSGKQLDSSTNIRMTHAEY